MRWLIGVSVVLVVVALSRAFRISARMIWSDMNRRFDALGDRLAGTASSLVEDLIDAHDRPNSQTRRSQ